MRAHLSLALGVLASLQSAQLAAADNLPIELETPKGCELAQIDAGVWRCDYITDKGRSRSVVLDFQEYVLPSEMRDYVSGLDDFGLEMYLNKELVMIDRERLGNVPPGDYTKHSHTFLGTFLGDGPTPVGFAACSILKDSMQLKNSETRSDRASLHCLGVSPSEGKLYQVILSLMDHHASTETDLEGLDMDFDDLASSLRAG